jgi:endonuclease-3
MNLRALPGGLTLSTLERSTVEELDEAIKKVGFHATKAASLKRLAVKLREEFGGEVPSELKDLLSLHGVGIYNQLGKMCVPPFLHLPLPLSS